MPTRLPWGVRMMRSCLRRPAASISASSDCRCSANSPYMLSVLLPIENDLARFAAVHDCEALFELPIVQAVGDDGRNIQPRIDHHRHLVPGLVHFATVDSLEGQHVENHRA